MDVRKISLQDSVERFRRLTKIKACKGTVKSL